jgi:glucose-6-phosphate 1-dehydrogenase
MAEKFGVQDRGKFYDETGTIRDVLQNHMLQVLASLTMDPPTGEECDAIREQKAALLKAVRPLDTAHVVRGQYVGYQSVPGVKSESTVETFFAAKLFIDSWRWAGVPIYIRAGKALPLTATEIMVDFKRPPRDCFAEIVSPASGHMRIRISPDVTIALGLRAKRPGEGMVGQDVELILTEQESAFMPPYQRLLGDAMHGIGDLFGRQDIVDAQWRIVDPVLDEKVPPIPYGQGSWGPEEANQLIGADGPWHNPQPAALRP